MQPNEAIEVVNLTRRQSDGLAERAPLAVVLRSRPAPRPNAGGETGTVDCAPRRRNCSARWRMLREPSRSA